MTFTPTEAAKDLARATNLLLQVYVAVHRDGWEEGPSEGEAFSDVSAFLFNQGYRVIFLTDGTLHPDVRTALGLPPLPQTSAQADGEGL